MNNYVHAYKVRNMFKVGLIIHTCIKKIYLVRGFICVQT